MVDTSHRTVTDKQTAFISLRKVMDLGYSEKMSQKALKKFAGDVDRAADWLFTQGIDGGSSVEEENLKEMIEGGQQPNLR